jgi:hypothetical protein
MLAQMDLLAYASDRPEHAVRSSHIQALAMNRERKLVAPLEDLQVFERNDAPSLRVAHPSSVVCILSSDSQSFGSWLEPRYIFGAETLV